MCVELYRIFVTLKSVGESLVLPAIHKAINDGKPGYEANGTAVFKGERMVGYLTPDESKSYLFIIDGVKGGVLTISSEGGDPNATLEISKNNTKNSFDYKDGKLKVTVKTDTTVYLDEFMGHNDALDEKQIAKLERIAESKLKNDIGEVIQKAQSEYDSDIFGFGNMIYKRDLKLWNRLKDNWDEVFKTLDVEVQTDVHIVNTASIKES